LALLLSGDVTAGSHTSASLLDHSSSSDQRVLLVEDNEDNRTIYSTVLRHLGYEVIEAEDGLRAVALARSELPALILMDISIPGIDGWEATRLLREDPATRAIPIVALTAHALADDRDRAAKAGFSSYLAKPIEPNLVVAEVRRWIGPAGAPPTRTGG
jgi:two-component system, cell cycle response regulator DivK